MTNNVSPQAQQALIFAEIFYDAAMQATAAEVPFFASPVFASLAPKAQQPWIDIGVFAVKRLGELNEGVSRISPAPDNEKE